MYQIFCCKLSKNIETTTNFINQTKGLPNNQVNSFGPFFLFMKFI